MLVNSLKTDSKSPATNGQKAKMESEIFSGSNSPTCIQFWYHMYGTLLILGDLNVWKLDKNNAIYTLLWTVSNVQGNAWNEGRFSYTHSSYHTIVFEGKLITQCGFTLSYTSLKQKYFSHKRNRIGRHCLG